MYVCICYAVTESELARHIDAGARDEDQLAAACGAGGGCGSCRDRLRALLRSPCPHPERVGAELALHS